MDLMRTNYVLIDYENVQPKNLSLLAADHFRVMIFVGESLVKIPIELAKGVQMLGMRAEYIQINGTGPNALDFHIAYYIGALSATDPRGFFHIISKDTGFDPLIRHLKQRNIFSKRSPTIDAIPLLGNISITPTKERRDAVVENLKKMPKNLPKKESSLRKMISAWFGKESAEHEVDSVMAELAKEGILRIEGTMLRYTLPE